MDIYEIFSVFSSGTRLKILEILMEGRICVSVIADRLKMSQPTVTQHLKVLRNAGLIDSKKVGYWMHYYVNKAGLKKIKDKVSLYMDSLDVKDTSCRVSPERCPRIASLKK
jgi:ArsR family transcriptional regulator